MRLLTARGVVASSKMFEVLIFIGFYLFYYSQVSIIRPGHSRLLEFEKKKIVLVV